MQSLLDNSTIEITEGYNMNSKSQTDLSDLFILS